MNEKEIFNEWKELLDIIHRDVRLYKDWLDCMKGFFGKDFPMIQKFEDIINRFNSNAELHMKHIAKFYNENIKKNINKTL